MRFSVRFPYTQIFIAIVALTTRSWLPAYAWATPGASPDPAPGSAANAAAVGLRPDVFAARTCAQHGDVDALAEVAARIATARMIDGRRELLRHHLARASAGASRWILRSLRPRRPTLERPAIDGLTLQQFLQQTVDRCLKLLNVYPQFEFLINGFGECVSINSCFYDDLAGGRSAD
jgi:hypothetical protein